MAAYRVIDLFCGAGGLSLGFMDAALDNAFELVLAIDHDHAAVRTHNLMLGDHCIQADIEQWLAEVDHVPQADVVMGGPPCQGFSLLNKKRVGDTRRALWEPFMDIVERSGARLFIMENVPGLLKSHEFQTIRERAWGLGFQVAAQILNTADYGVPQTRQRTIVFAWKQDALHQITFPPPPTHQQKPSGDRFPWRTVADAIADLKPPVGTAVRQIPPPYNLHFGRNPTPTSQARYRAVPPGGNRFDLQRNAPELTPACWLRKPSGGTDLFGRLWWDRPSVTIRTEFFKPEKGRYLHPDQHRPITHREAARLMGFPDDYLFQGNKAEIARQIGNAVPPPLARAIARITREALDQMLVLV